MAFVALALIAGCGTNGGGSPGAPEAEAPLDRNEVPGSSCGDIDPDGALATFSGSPCGWTLRPQDDGTVELVHSIKTPTRSAGVMPLPCETLPCSVRGLETPVGPVLVLEVRGLESEVPAGVWLGVVLGNSLRFVDLWEDAGAVVVDGGISLGPAHALAPFDCEGTLALFPEARLPGGAAVPPPVSLQRRAGALASEAAAVSRGRCELLWVGLP
ncbi:MAG: hypothetical protein KUG77_06125 [Nannocystaceae bacterium]|nr:hypothetical protein [Nannocystaceae bacterium]